MLSRFITLYPAIKRALRTDDKFQYAKFEKFNLADEELDFLEQTRDIFKLFVRITERLQAEYMPTVQYIAPSIFYLREKLKNIENDESFWLIIRNACKKGLEKLNKWLLELNRKNLDENLPFYLGVILDPRFKLRSFAK
jgi:hypothetical protein